MNRIIYRDQGNVSSKDKGRGALSCENFSIVNLDEEDRNKNREETHSEELFCWRTGWAAGWKHWNGKHPWSKGWWPGWGEVRWGEESGQEKLQLIKEMGKRSLRWRGKSAGDGTDKYTYFGISPPKASHKSCPPSLVTPRETLQSFTLPLQISCWAQGMEVRVVQKCRGTCPLIEKQFSLAPWLQRILRHSTFAVSHAMWIAAFPLGRQLIVALWLSRTERLSRCPYMTARWSPVAQDIFNL